MKIEYPLIFLSSLVIAVSFINIVAGDLEDQQLRLMDTNEMWDLIKKGDIINNVTINMDISSDSWFSQFKHASIPSINIINSHINGNINFDNVSFNKSINFYNTNINGKVSFQTSEFLDDVNFSRSKFIKGADFSDTKFYGITGFNSSRFGDDARFGNAIFVKDAYFPLSDMIGEADYSDAEFQGIAHFEGVNFTEEVRFDNANFSQAAYFIGSQFDGDANYDGAEFCEVAYFNKANYLGETKFSNVKFHNFVNFGDTGFYGDSASFYKTNFYKNSIFDKANLTAKEIDFGKTNFTEYVSFNSVNFSEGDVDFEEANFFGWTEFAGSSFKGNTNFEQSEFNRQAIFKGSIFGSDVDFTGVQFKEDVLFNYAFFLGNLVFEGSKFAGNADFSYSKFNKSILLNKAEFKEKALFYDANLSDSVEICLNETQFNKIYLRWEKIKPGFFKNCRLIYNEEAYLSLIDNYKKLGWLNDANECFYEYKNNYRSTTLRGIYWIADIFQWLLHGYGVKPDFSIIWSLFVVVACAIFFWRINETYLFSWDEIPGKDDEKLIEFLTHKAGVGWAKIEKTDNDKAIRGSTEKNFFSLELNDKNTGLNLEIDGIRADKLIVKMEKGKLNVYDQTKLADAFAFSTTVFLSGTGKFFVEKPDYSPQNNAFLCRTVFNLERLLGCTLIFMFIISVSKTIGA